MSLWRWLRSQGSGSKRDGRAGRRHLPSLEVLEARVVPATVTVVSAADHGVGTLRAALATAHAGDTIAFALKAGSTIKLTGDELVIARSLTLKGPGASALAVSGNHTSRVFDITSSTATVSISGLTIENGRTTATGGGIKDLGKSLTLTSVALTGHVA